MNDSRIQVPPALYMAQVQPNGSGHIIVHQIRTVIIIIHTCTWICERDFMEGEEH